MTVLFSPYESYFDKEGRPTLQGQQLLYRISQAVVAAPTSHTHDQADINGLVDALAAKQDTLVSGANIKTVNGTSLLGAGDLVVSGGNAVAVTVAFGGGFTDKAQTVVTGQAWVEAGSNIVASVLCPAAVDPDEMYLLDLRPTVSDLVAGVGFTVTVYSEPQASGDYTVNCIGV